MKKLVSINRHKNSIRKASWLFLCLVFTFNLKAQVNLVPNPSFEIYDTCPGNGADMICKAVPWFQPNDPNNLGWCGGSTDFFNVCGNTVPNNFAGYQYARTGNGYAGAGIFSGPGFASDDNREYLEVKLDATLKLEKKYCISYYVNLNNNFYYIGISSFDVFFSTDSLLYSSNLYSNIGVLPSVQNSHNNIIIDSLNWPLIKGIYIAQGNENFMTVGNLTLGAQVNYICLHPSCGGGYYYFDDFSVVELPEITAGIDASICPGESAQLNASCTGCWPGLQYRWFPAEGLSNATVLNPLASPLQTTAYYFGLTDPTGAVPCMEDHIDSITIFVTPAPIEAGPDVTIPEGGSTVLMAEGGVSYEWYPTEGLSCTACKDPAATPGSSTTYYVTGVNPEGCTGTDSVKVTIVDTSCGEVFVPNVFSPNGDGQNDLQCVYGPCIEQIKFAIYNRWGQKVFETNNREICWDGTYKDTRLNNGVFVYTLTATLSTGLSVRQKGHITLLR